MAYRRRMRRATIRRKFKRRSYGKRKSPYTAAKLKRRQPRRFMISRAMPWPDQAFTTVTFNENVVMTTTTGPITMNQFEFKMNNLFQPGGTSESAKGHSDWANMYSQYRVMGCAVQATVFTQSANASSQGVVYINWLGSTENTDLVATSTVNDVQGMRNTIWKPYGTSAGGPGPQTIRSYRSVKSLERDSVFADGDYAALTTAGPSVQPTFFLGIALAAVAGTAATFVVSLRMKFYVKYFQPVKGTLVQPS